MFLKRPWKGVKGEIKTLLHIFGDLFVPVSSWRAMEEVEVHPPEDTLVSVTFPWVPSKVKDTVVLKYVFFFQKVLQEITTHSKYN